MASRQAVFKCLKILWATRCVLPHIDVSPGSLDQHQGEWLDDLSYGTEILGVKSKEHRSFFVCFVVLRNEPRALCMLSYTPQFHRGSMGWPLCSTKCCGFAVLTGE